MLIAAAAARLGVPGGDLVVENGSILHKASGKSVTYGAVAADAAKLEMPSGVRLKDRGDWKILGKPQARKDMLAKVTGAPIFGVDVTLARHALRHGQDEPALLGEAGQVRHLQGREDAGRRQDRADRHDLRLGLRRHCRKHLGGLQCRRCHRGGVGRGRISGRQRCDLQGAAGALRGRGFGASRRRRRRKGLRRCAARPACRSRIFRALPRACLHGADERDGAAEGRRARPLVAEPGSDRDALSVRRCRRHRTATRPMCTPRSSAAASAAAARSISRCSRHCWPGRPAAARSR